MLNNKFFFSKAISSARLFRDKKRLPISKLSIQICSALLLVFSCSCNKEKTTVKTEATSQALEKKQEAAAWKKLSKERIQAVKNKEYSRAIALIQDFIDLYPLSKYKAQADEYLEYLETRQAGLLKKENRRKEKKIASIMSRLQRDAQSFIDLQDFASAIELFENYRGELQQETSQKRLVQIATIKKLLPKKRDTFAKAVETVEEEVDVDSILSEVTENIIAGKSLDALKKHAKANKESIPELAKILTDLTKVKSTMKKYFLKKKGKVITLTIKGKPTRVKVVNAGSSKLTVLRKVGAHSLKTKVSYKDLTLEDQVSAIASLGSETAAVYGLYKSAKANDAHALMKYSKQTQLFASHTKEFVAPLIRKAEVKKQQKAAPKVTQAKESARTNENRDEIDHNKLKLKAIVKKQKKLANNGDYDDKVQNMEFYLKLENRNRTASVDGYKTHLFIFGKSVLDSKLYTLVAKLSEDVSIESLGEFRTAEGLVTLNYDDNRTCQYGSKYHSYMAFLEDPDGETVLLSGKMSLFKKYHREIAELPERSEFTVSASKGIRSRGRNSYSSVSYR